MNVIVVPDASMIVIPLIEKNGHTYLSPSNFSKYDNTSILEGNLNFDNLINSYGSSELPSGIRARLFLFSKVVNDADAAIIIGKRPKNRVPLYNALNDLILFGGNSCDNAHSLFVKIINDLNIPTLKLAYPTSQKQIIDLIDNTNYFLKNMDCDSNPDNLGTNLQPKKVKSQVFDVKEILDRLI
jgi:putative methanogenesis marker protein 5